MTMTTHLPTHIIMTMVTSTPIHTTRTTATPTQIHTPMAITSLTAPTMTLKMTTPMPTLQTSPLATTMAAASMATIPTTAAEMSWATGECTTGRPILSIQGIGELPVLLSLESLIDTSVPVQRKATWETTGQEDRRTFATTTTGLCLILEPLTTITTSPR